MKRKAAANILQLINTVETLIQHKLPTLQRTRNICTSHTPIRTYMHTPIYLHVNVHVYIYVHAYTSRMQMKYNLHYTLIQEVPDRLRRKHNCHLIIIVIIDMWTRLSELFSVFFFFFLFLFSFLVFVPQSQQTERLQTCECIYVKFVNLLLWVFSLSEGCR